MTLNNNSTLNNGFANGKGIDVNCNSFDSAEKTDANLEENGTSQRRSCREICTIGSLLLFGFILLTFGILTTKFTLFEIVMNERLRMLPIYPSYYWWEKPKNADVFLNVYIFNITNSAEFVAGIDKKIKLQEIGPIMYREELEHKDIVFHDENSTLSYTVHRRLVFKESTNVKGILNQTVIVPNMAALSAASYVSNNAILRFPYKILMRTHKTKAVINTTIYNYLWNLTDPVLVFTQKFVPFLVPTKETGILQNIYKNFTDRVNVLIGEKHGHEKFFQIQQWNYRPTVPRFYPENGECDANLQGSTEGALYPQYLTKQTILWYWRKTLCRIAPLHFEQEIQKGPLKGYKYVLRDNVFDRFENKTADCYKGANLPDGLTDVSKCFFDQPIVASPPHFNGRFGPWTQKLEGLHPNQSKHESYTVLEPFLGVPLDSRAASQSNLALNDLSAFDSDIAKFSNLILPMFWMEYHLKDFHLQDPLITNTVHFIVNILPKIQYWISGGFIIIGLCLLTIGYLRLRNNETNRSEPKAKGAVKKS